MICKHCGENNEDTALYCGVCGTRLDDKKPCPKCGFFNEQESVYCMQCGTRLDGKKVCSCGATYEGNFCTACGKGAPVHNEAKPVKAPLSFKESLEKMKKPLQLFSGALAILAVFFSFVFLFCIGFKDPAGGTMSIYDYFVDVFEEISTLSKQVEDTEFKTFFGVAGYTYAAVGLVGAIATLATVITFATIATVRYVQGLQGKTEKSAMKWCVMTFLSFAAGVGFLYSLNVAEIAYSMYGIDVSTGSLVECNGATMAGLVLGAISIAGAFICHLAANFRKEDIKKYAFAAGLTVVGVIVFCLVRTAAFGMEMTTTLSGTSVDIYARENPLSFLCGFIVGLGTPRQEYLTYCDNFFLKMDIYTILFEVFAILAIVFITIALYKTLKLFHEGKKFPVASYIVSVIASVGLLVTTLLMRSAFQTFYTQTGLKETDATIFFGWCIVLIVFSVIGLVGAIIANKMTAKNED